MHTVARKTFLLGTGFAIAALTACTVYGKKPAPSSAPTAAPTGAPTLTSGPSGAPAPTAAANAIASTSEVPQGSGVIRGDTVLTQPSAGEFKAFSAVCTHAGCNVNAVENGTINCPCHKSKFNLDGSVASGPASRPLESKSIAVQGESIVLA